MSFAKIYNLLVNRRLFDYIFICFDGVLMAEKCHYFPTQKCLNMVPKTSSVVMAPPVI